MSEIHVGEWFKMRIPSDQDRKSIHLGIITVFTSVVFFDAFKLVWDWYSNSRYSGAAGIFAAFIALFVMFFLIIFAYIFGLVFYTTTSEFFKQIKKLLRFLDSKFTASLNPLMRKLINFIKGIRIIRN